MLSFVTSLFLCAILTTVQGQDYKVPDVKVDKSHPTSEVLILYDITTIMDVGNFTYSLSGVHLRHKFRVTGTNRYFLVSSLSNEDELSNPKWQKVTQNTMITQYPVMHAISYFKVLFDVDSGWNENDETDHFVDKNLKIVIFDFLFPPGTSVSQFDEMMSKYAQQYTKTDNVIKPVSYVVIGRYPVRMYFIVNLNDNAVQKLTKDGLDVIGGPGNVKVEILHLHKA